MQAFKPALTDSRRPGLTTAYATALERAGPAGQLFVRQTHKLYSEADHATWRYLCSRMRERWVRYANERFLEGLEGLHLPEDRVPRLTDVNAFLAPRTGFRAQAVSGCLPAFVFFDCLRNRKFPTAVCIRSEDSLDWLSEPDIFHDVAGHVPMHTDRAFAEALVAFGNCAHTAVEIVGGMRDPEERLRRLTSIVKAMARFFWFTVEYGLMRYGNRLKAYGSGLLSSAGEIEHAIDSPQVQRSDMHLDWVIHQSFEIGHYQPLLFIVESFDQLHELTATLERWMREGRLDHVAGGEPNVSSADLDSFLHGGGWRRFSRWRSSHRRSSH
jgi:phenylalanine-4-hydroxylase